MHPQVKLPNRAAALLAATASLAAASYGQAPSLPLHQYTSFQAVGPQIPASFLYYQKRTAMDGVLGAGSTDQQKLAGTFKVDPGLADSTCYSFEAKALPGHYLRHLDQDIVLNAIPTTPKHNEFNEDATWCVAPGLAGTGISFESRNAPQRYIRRNGAKLVLGYPGDSPAFDQDASWTAVTALDEFAPFIYPRPGQTKGPGVLPPAVDTAVFLGPIHYNDPSTARDLGFSGVVNGQSIWTFGDTLDPTLMPISFCSNDSAALGDYNNPLNVYDKNVNSDGCTQQWIPLTADEQSTGGGSRWAEGGTNVVEYALNQGLVWFLENDRSSGFDNIQGAGVATVTANSSGPLAVRTMDRLFDSTEPAWGDVGVTFNPLDNKVYVYGHGPISANLKNDVYLARVPAPLAQDVSAYQYWNNSTKAWTKQPFGNGQNGTLNIGDAQALFTQNSLGQSYPFWNNYYNTWMFVYGTGFIYTDIQVMTAPKLEGPWTVGYTIAPTCPTGKCGFRYAIEPHPEYDPTGKTLLVTWTDSNVVNATKITWK